MISLAEMESMLNKIVDEFPPELFKELNGGVILLPDAKIHPDVKDNNLYILGEYHAERSLGRYIAIYYGSFIRVYGYLDENGIKENLIRILKHEITHHIESLAGEKDLERKDLKHLEDYLQNN